MKSNRDGIGAIVRVTAPEGTQSRMVKIGSSYLAQSELAVTFGLVHCDKADRVAVEWPSGYSQEFRNVGVGNWRCVEGNRDLTRTPWEVVNVAGWVDQARP